MIERIKNLSEEYFHYIKEIRHILHSNPELSFEEYKTAEFIESKLTEIGISDFNRIAKTGITFTISGEKEPSEKITALRADIDALPIQEQNDVPYKSKNDGLMHACGHDVHTSCLLGAVKILNELKSEFSGKIKVIFQPGEEKLPGGASLVIKEGFLQSPKPKSILGQHVMPLIDAGKVGFRKGMYMASADEVYIKIVGKGGHAAAPEYLNDPVLAASQVIVSLQQLISRRNNPRTPSVLSIGKVEANGATNVIPNEVKLEGTFRTFNEEWRNQAHSLIKEIAENTALAYGCKAEVDVKVGYPFLNNSEEYTQKMISAAENYMGKENVIELDIWLAGEDFAFYSQHIDACFYRLGTRNEARNITSGVHTPTFNIDEEAIKTGMGLMAYLTIHELENS